MAMSLSKMLGDRKKRVLLWHADKRKKKPNEKFYRDESVS